MRFHVGIDDDDLRVDLMNRVIYFLRHILSLSTSSSFWKGENTGLKSYRLSGFDELPRAGIFIDELPRAGIFNDFEPYSEYQRHVTSLVDAVMIEDAPNYGGCTPKPKLHFT